MKQGTISQIENDGQWSNNYGTFTSFRVTFTDGQVYRFNAKGDFTKRVGDFVEYEVTNEETKSAKLVFSKPNDYKGNSQQKSSDTQTQIVRQSMIKAAIDYHAMQNVPLDTIKETARQLIKFIETGN